MHLSRHFSFALIFIFLFADLSAQKLQDQIPFSIRLEKMEIPGLPALQSFVIGEWNGKWLLLAGRNDGLHRRQPWASFDEEGQNKYIYVVDPLMNKVWKQTLEHLPLKVAEQFQSTNIGFYQDKDKLIITGGYGYSRSADDHITFPNLSVIHLEQMIDAVINGLPLAATVFQVKDERMAITGGRLAKIGDTMILAGGQRFDGRYNPHGPDHGPGFIQQYSNEIRKFTLQYENNIPVVKYYSAINDSINLHRRDYNLVPQVFSDNEFGYTMYSGVFQYNADLPFTNFVDIKGGSYQVNNGFHQQFSHYHSAVLPLYDRELGNMYSIFFGGIAQYYPDAKGKIHDDADVPFTKTISVVRRNKNTTIETFLPVQMPGYLGAGAEFIFASGISQAGGNGIADMNNVPGNETLIGYIIRGINSSDQNIFWDNNGKESKDSSAVFKVYITIGK